MISVMGEKIARLGIERDADLDYYLKDGDVWATRRTKGGPGSKRDLKVAATGIELDFATYLYFIDEDGDLARKSRQPERSPASTKAPRALEAFSWGYAGWGPYTKELVTLVDAVERARGFAPPLFVDVRLRRMVRAPGFRERAFEELMGERQVWMPQLGNLAIADEEITMTIAEPAAAGDLLTRIEEANQAGRRVIFFCACASPTMRESCHRGEVTELLGAAARKRRLSLTVQEWPGGAPERRDVAISDDDLKVLKRHLTAKGATTIAVPPGMELAEAGALPHYTVMRCSAGDDALWAITGAAVYTAQGWRLPVYTTMSSDEKGATLLRRVRERFTEDALAPFVSRRR